MNQEEELTACAFAQLGAYENARLLGGGWVEELTLYEEMACSFEAIHQSNELSDYWSDADDWSKTLHAFWEQHKRDYFDFPFSKENEMRAVV